jgi:hypothetical protein
VGKIFEDEKIIVSFVFNFDDASDPDGGGGRHPFRVKIGRGRNFWINWSGEKEATRNHNFNPLGKLLLQGGGESSGVVSGK